jgi:hypothetical protein
MKLLTHGDVDLLSRESTVTAATSPGPSGGEAHVGGRVVLVTIIAWLFSRRETTSPFFTR